VSLSVIIAAGDPACPHTFCGALKLIIRVGIGNAQRFEHLRFEAFHLKSLSFFNVIVANKMQEAVDDEMGKMLDKSDPLFLRFPRQRLQGEGDIADKALDRAEGFDLREAQDVGGLVDLPPLAVEDALVGIIGQQNRDLRDARDLCLGLFQRLPNRLFGDGLKPFGPVAGLNGDGDLERRRRGAQWDLSSLAVAPS
jgi:hypothetical protein